MLGYDVDELRGRNAWNYYARRDDDERRQVLARDIAKSDGTISDRVTLLHRDGREIEVSYTLRVLNDGAMYASVVTPLNAAAESVSRLRKIADELVSRRARRDVAGRKRALVGHRSHLSALPEPLPSRRKTA